MKEAISEAVGDHEVRAVYQMGRSWNSVAVVETESEQGKKLFAVKALTLKMIQARKDIMIKKRFLLKCCIQWESRFQG